MNALLLVLLHAALAAPPPPWPGTVRVQGIHASGTGLHWDPALTDGPPAADREIAWAAAEDLEIRPSTWYQRIGPTRLIRPLQTLDPKVLDADAGRVGDWFHHHGWPAATVTWKLSPGRRPRLEDVTFVVIPGPRDPAWHRPLTRPPPPIGWHVHPVLTGLSRGTAVSLYGGVHGEWRQPAVHPNTLLLHAEVGFRAFPALPDLPAIRFYGNLGLWSSLRAGWSRELGQDLAVFAEARGTSDLWPAVNEAETWVRGGVRWGLRGPVTFEAAVRGGWWTSWAWPAQEEAYAAWFGGSPLVDGQRQFAPAYAYARLDLSAIADTTDRRVDPRRGVRVALTTTPFGYALDAPFYRAQVDVRAFVPLVGDRWTLALRGRAGGIDWEDPAQRGLLGERFFLGAHDLRAWGQREVMPPSYAGGPEDLRPGGNLTTWANLTVRWHVHRDFTLSALVDTGRVWEGWSQVAASRLLWDVGFSGAVPSPLGLVRLDVAWRLTSQPTDGPIPIGFQLRLNPSW